LDTPEVPFDEGADKDVASSEFPELDAIASSEIPELMTEADSEME
jgi:hypothetical protein